MAELSAPGGQDPPCDRAADSGAASLNSTQGVAGPGQRAEPARPKAGGLAEQQQARARDFADLRYEWRRLFGEALGTFLLVVVAVGAGVVDARSAGVVGRAASVVAPGLMVAAIILFMGAVSGAHLNPVITLAFALRRDFQWRRVPGYLLAQAVGAVLACALLAATFGGVWPAGATRPGPGFTVVQALVVEALLTAGLVSTVLGTASTAQNVGPLAAIGVGAYIALAGLWAGPVSGASMNPARSLAPDLLTRHLHDSWIYLAGPAAGTLLAVAAAYVLRGSGGGLVDSQAAQGTLGARRTQGS